MGQNAALEFSTLIAILARPEAFPLKLPTDEVVPVVQTHASVVLLTPDYVYKLKKPKNYGFFDYSTPENRRHFCEQEVLLNARLAPHVYLGVAPVLLFSGEMVRFGPTFAPGEIPQPAAIIDGGTVIDYAVVMVRLPDEATVEARIQAGTIEPSMLTEVARRIAAFHAATQTNEHIASFGSLDVIRDNWEENFAQMQPYIGRTIETNAYDRIVTYIRHFMVERTQLFMSRVRDGRIRDCHGDLRLQHIYIFDTPDAQQRLAILDCIEFNERFRYSDVASEVAFLTMELDGVNRSDLARTFIDSYCAESGDQALRELLPFYSCYRACVRGKVFSFQLDGPEVPAEQRANAQREAMAMFQLAERYTTGPTRPTLLLVGGIMGTGKTSLVHALQLALGWQAFSSDQVRKQLAQLDPALPQEHAFGQGLYAPEWTARTYDELCIKAPSVLAEARSVILDATFIKRANRQAAAHQGRERGARVIFVECVCPQEIVLQRLARRWRKRTENVHNAYQASDGRPDLYAQQLAAWEAFDADLEPGVEHIIVDTTGPLAAIVERVVDALHMSSLTNTSG